MDHDQTTKGSILSYKLREIPCLYSFENLFKEKEISKKRKKTTGRILSDKTLVLIVITERKNSNLIPDGAPTSLKNSLRAKTKWYN